MSMFIGESLVGGETNEVAHIDMLIGPKSGPVGTAFANALARHGGPRPAVGQTPREFAAVAHRFLLGRPAAAPFAAVPSEVVDRLYRVRFGGQALAADEAAEAEAHLGRLAAALRVR